MITTHHISNKNSIEPLQLMTLQPYPDGAYFAGGENNGYNWGLVEDQHYAHEAFAQNYNGTVCSGWVGAGDGQAYAQTPTTWESGSNASWFNLNN